VTSSSRPTRATVAGRAYLDLQNLARRQRRPTDELHQLYALEGFLARLTVSAHANKLVLKGGVLLAAYDARRPTRDIDMQARAVAGERDDVLDRVRQIAAIRIDDGLVFDADAAAAEIIRDEDEHSGVRVTLTATLASAKLSLHVDVNIGDPIWPAPREIDLPRLLGGTITLAGYPLQMVYAEKIITALQRGTINTRWRDFADLYLLTARHTVDGADLHRALTEVAAYRHVERHRWQTCSLGTPRSRRRVGLPGDASSASTIASPPHSSRSSTRSSRSPTPPSQAALPVSSGTLRDGLGCNCRRAPRSEDHARMNRPGLRIGLRHNGTGLRFPSGLVLQDIENLRCSERRWEKFRDV